MFWVHFLWRTFAPLLRGLWELRFKMNILRSSEVEIIHMCRRIKRASLVVPFTRRISIIATSLTATTQSNLALQDRAHLSIVPFLSLAWEWYASVVVTHIVVGIVVGQENAPCAVKTIRI
jgi:hypothetical protein